VYSPVVWVGDACSCFSIFSFMCMFCRSLFALLSFFFGHCVFCRSLIYASDNPFGIFKLFLLHVSHMHICGMHYVSNFRFTNVCFPTWYLMNITGFEFGVYYLVYYHIFCCNMFVFACPIIARSQCWLFAPKALKYPYLPSNSTSGICAMV